MSFAEPLDPDAVLAEVRKHSRVVRLIVELAEQKVDKEAKS